MTRPRGKEEIPREQLAGEILSASHRRAVFYRELRRIRRVEEEIIRLYPTDKIKSPVHLSIGQESVSVGICHALHDNDIVVGTYRGHALYLAKGGDMGAMMAELYGKSGGTARGKAGSMHLSDLARGVVGTSAIVASGIPQAVGYAFAAKQKRPGQIVACFFGEGAMDEGAWHESMNFAALKKLPILFVCENNFYAIYSNVRERVPAVNICERAESYRIPAERIEGGNTERISDRATESLAAIRAGSGPRFLECETYRWRDHVGPGEDRIYKYRPDAELDAWIENDELRRLASLLPTDLCAKIDAEIEAEVACAIAFAEQSSYPASSELDLHVFRD